MLKLCKNQYLLVLKKQRRPKFINRFYNKQYLHNIRNVGVAAHIDAGKTTTTEQMLYICGEIKSVGRVDSGDTVMDFLPQERERGITISAAAISFNWKDCNINLIDTPGHVDFTIEVERSVRVLDGSIIIIDAVSGVQSQTRTVWKQIKKQNIPAIAFINKMDRNGANFQRSIDSMKQKLNVNVIPIQLAVGIEENFKGVIDLLSLTKLTWDNDNNNNKNNTNKNVTNCTPKRFLLKNDDEDFIMANNARRIMIESIAEVDEEFMQFYFENIDNIDNIKIVDIITALKRCCIKGSVVPALCGSSLKGKGVEPLLDAIIAFLPSPLECPPTIAINSLNGDKIEIEPKSDSTTCALAFKVVNDTARGNMVYVRTYSGILHAKQVIHNSSRNIKERSNQLLKVSADEYTSISSLGPGQVGCIIGLKNTFTGDTLVADKSPLHSYILDGLTIPKPVFSLSIEPEKTSQQTELENALNILKLEDPSLQVDIDEESGQTMLRGIGELHLEIVCDKLKRQFNIDVTTGKAYVNYRERISESYGEIENEYEYDRTIAGKRMFASLTLGVLPLGNCTEPELIVSESIRKSMSTDEYASLLEGIYSSLGKGKTGFPVVGVKVTVKDFKRDSDTTAGAIRACAAISMDKIYASDGHEVLEPFMLLEVEVTSQFVGEVLSDITIKRRGQITEIVTKDNMNVICAKVPLEAMLGYATTIRSMTQGEGIFSLEYIEHLPTTK